MSLYDDLNKGFPQLAVLVDPDKANEPNLSTLKSLFKAYAPDLLLLGGSGKSNGSLGSVVRSLKEYTSSPIILFPGDEDQLTGEADGLLFLSLISGRNPEFLIGQQVRSSLKVRALGLKSLPMGYILIDGKRHSSAARYTGTFPLSKDDLNSIVSTAVAGELLGMKAIYLEAGSGADEPISEEIIREVRAATKGLLFVGGGIRTTTDVHCAISAGADILVIGTILETDPSQLPVLFSAFKNYQMS